MRAIVLLLVFYLCFSELLENKISERVIRDISLKNGATSILIMLKIQVNFDQVRMNGLLAREMDERMRGFFVMNTLMQNANSTQREILSILKKDNLNYQSFWIQNCITVQNAPKSIIYELALRDDVDFIGSDELNYNEIEQMHGEPENKKDTREIEWNVKWIKADKLWDLGFNGTGMVVGGADTGVEYKHESLVSNYRGKNGDQFNHDYNWYDGVRDFNPCRSPCGCSTKEPCDDHSHGTHTLGTAVGGVSKKIGVSPGSKWIACRPFTDTGRHYSVSTFVSCLQFFAAPTDVSGKNPNPNLRPHTTVHSYGCNAQLGCPGPRDLEPASEALKAAGVFMIVAAHNQGPSCSSITRQPCHYKSVVTIGALDFQSDRIASYSSRGPIRVDNSNRRKPDLSAPGSNVYSAVRNNQYARYSGTSMATPAVAGAISLFWSAKPSLVRNLEKTLEIFERSAKRMDTNDCGSNGTPNNVYGWGGIDVHRAYELATEMGY